MIYNFPRYFSIRENEDITSSARSQSVTLKRFPLQESPVLNAESNYFYVPSVQKTALPHGFFCTGFSLINADSCAGCISIAIAFLPQGIALCQPFRRLSLSFRFSQVEWFFIATN